ncbi:hypothetical protein [Aeromonas phage Asp37]|nr:hypothetical protein [Aeromonas phage Asp37]
MSNQLTARQAGALLGYLENHLNALCEHYRVKGFRKDRADNALDELSGLRYGESGSGLSPVDAILILQFVTETGGFENAPVISQLNEMKKQRKAEATQ